MFRLRHREGTEQVAQGDRQLGAEAGLGPGRKIDAIQRIRRRARCRSGACGAARTRRGRARRDDLRRKAFDILEDRRLRSSSVDPGAPMSEPGACAAADDSEQRREIGAPGVMRELNVPFPTVNGGSERLDVYLAVGPCLRSRGRPVLIAIHGGGWRRLDKAGYGARIASAFVPRGYVVVAPDYELSGRDKPTWPVNLEDVQAAVRWVRENASMLGINPNEIAAIGESAGPTWRLWSEPTRWRGRAMREARPPVEAVVAFSTPTDLTALDVESPLAGRAASAVPGWDARSSCRRNYAGGVADRSCFCR